MNEADPCAACVDMDHVIRQKTYMQTIAEQANKATITLMRDAERREQLVTTAVSALHHSRRCALHQTPNSNSPCRPSPPLKSRSAIGRQVTLAWASQWAARAGSSSQAAQGKR